MLLTLTHRHVVAVGGVMVVFQGTPRLGEKGKARLLMQ